MAINNPKFLVIHCSDVSYRKSDNQFNSINNYHRDEREFPKSSLGLYVGYHRLLTNGQNYKCKEDWEEGAHCNQIINGVSMNFQSLGICLAMDGDIEQPPQYQVDLLKAQILEWQKVYNIPTENVKFHRDFQPAKTCPGSLITREWLLALLKPKEQIETQLSLLQELLALLIQLRDALRSKLLLGNQNTFMPSTQIIAVVVLILSQLLPYIGVTVDSKQLETSIQTIVALITGIWIWIQNRKLHKAIAIGSRESLTLGMKS